MASLYYDPSTRTRLSFESAMIKVGGQYISTENASQFSSAIKGESLEDTIRIVNLYSDVIVLRHPQKGASQIASHVSDAPIINAGDGNGEHPTQALLDLYTIFSKFKNKKITVALIGDLKNYRSSHSLAILLSLYSDIKIIFISPKVLKIPSNLKKLLKNKNISFEETEDLISGIKKADIIYQTRIPKEYLSKSDYKKYKGKYILDTNTAKFIKKSSFIMHPLPRVDEIHIDLDSDKRSIYFEQASNGLYLRMAILLLLFDKAA